MVKSGDKRQQWKRSRAQLEKFQKIIKNYYSRSLTGEKRNNFAFLSLAKVK